jgi:hypothetical protein
VLELAARIVATIPSLGHPCVIKERLELRHAGQDHILHEPVRHSSIAPVAPFRFGHALPEVILLQLLPLITQG